jgi:NADH-quinone oxidoreductase subunit M
MVGVFIARDLIFFYICFELTLVPMFFLIAIYGGSDRARASYKFFIYTFTGSLIALAGLLYIAWQYAAANGVWSFNIAALTDFAVTLTPREQAWILLALLAGFAVKVPLFPVHTWLPLAHTEAPTAGSVVLAAVLLKLGTYGLYRFVLPMVPVAVVEYAPLIAVLSIVGILYAALICWVQSDIKKLIAYSSVSHLGFCVLGMFALNPLGLQGSVLYMINHGLSTGALFFLVGMIYERYHTREMDKMSGLARRMPVWAFFMVFFVLASVGLPGLNGFVSEFLCLIASFTATPENPVYPGVLGPWYAAFAGVGMIFAAMYLLIMTGRVVFGPLKEPHGNDHHGHDEGHLPPDLTLREIGVLTPLAVLCLYLGFQFHPLTNAMERPIENVLAVYPVIVQDVAVSRSGDLAIESPVTVNSTSPSHQIAASPNLATSGGDR